MNTNKIEVDKFSNPDSERLYHEQWPNEPELRVQASEDCRQCGGCSFFAPFNSDWGLCCNAESRHHLETVFEHFSCPAIAHEGWGSHSFSSDSCDFCRCNGYTPLAENLDLICLEVQYLERSETHCRVALVVNPAISSEETGEYFALKSIEDQVEQVLAQYTPNAD